MKAVKKQITTPFNKRIICISDIHGNLDLLLKLLNKVEYSSKDILILLGDLYTKGRQCHETLKYIIELSHNPNVHILRGNCDDILEYLSENEKIWLDNLPHILESQEYIFVHGGLNSNCLENEEAETCMKNDAFMEKGLKFDKYIITGHWPTINYTHEIPCFNPIINNESRIISIDGGNVLKNAGQLNAFMIFNDSFSFDYVDDLQEFRVLKSQSAGGGSLNITWLDRFVELVEAGEIISQYRHIKTGKILDIPNNSVWKDQNGNLCECDNGTDYYLKVDKDEIVSLVGSFGNKILAKKNGTVGWINI